MHTERNCPNCDGPVSGRIDKRFCSDLCRNDYHNKERISDARSVRYVNQILNRNRKILRDCSSSRSPKFPTAYLSSRGFDFNYFTHQVKDARGDVHVYCYDLGYQKLDDGYISLILDKHESES